MSMDVNFAIQHNLDPIALYAAIVATSVLIWDIIKWYRAGPVLKTSVMVPAEIISAAPKVDNNDYMVLTISNSGGASTTLTNLGVVYWPSLWKKMINKGAKNFFVANPDIGGGGKNLPFELKVGAQWSGGAIYDAKLKDMANSGYLYFYLFHSFSKTPVKCRIKETPLKDKRAADRH
jgi:hypothetical protein